MFPFSFIVDSLVAQYVVHCVQKYQRNLLHQKTAAVCRVIFTLGILTFFFLFMYAFTLRTRCPYTETEVLGAMNYAPPYSPEFI